ncbi:hypothetical protein CUMW_238670 [Citrus unshiu]|uniref:Uncharacterized protein n=1 Tax=Citrus unshiu TaxID=55188 RepID=A0A2H5QKF0_CITUN|nr:hypothetical protein CUMW_238670 [Citrus unshiu]
MHHSTPSALLSTLPSMSVSRDKTKATLFVLSTLYSSPCSSSSLSTPRHPSPVALSTHKPNLTCLAFPSKIPSHLAPPSLAYLISGSAGDATEIVQLLHANH